MACWSDLLSVSWLVKSWMHTKPRGEGLMLLAPQQGLARGCLCQVWGKQDKYTRNRVSEKGGREKRKE